MNKEALFKELEEIKKYFEKNPINSSSKYQNSEEYRFVNPEKNDFPIDSRYEYN